MFMYKINIILEFEICIQHSACSQNKWTVCVFLFLFYCFFGVFLRQRESCVITIVHPYGLKGALFLFRLVLNVLILCFKARDNMFIILHATYRKFSDSRI